MDSDTCLLCRSDSLFDIPSQRIDNADNAVAAQGIAIGGIVILPANRQSI